MRTAASYYLRFCWKYAKYIIREFSKRDVLYLQSYHILFNFQAFFCFFMINLSSPQYQVSNFIINIAYSGQT